MVDDMRGVYEPSVGEEEIGDDGWRSRVCWEGARQENSYPLGSKASSRCIVASTERARRMRRWRGI
jgi:hypothetical protein